MSEITQYADMFDEELCFLEKVNFSFILFSSLKKTGTSRSVKKYSPKLQKIYPNVQVIYNTKAEICKMFLCGFLTVEETCNIVPAHATYIDFSFGKAKYRLDAVYGPYGPKTQEDNAFFFSENIFDGGIFNTKKHTITVGDWNIGIFPQFD